MIHPLKLADEVVELDRELRCVCQLRKLAQPVAVVTHQPRDILVLRRVHECGTCGGRVRSEEGAMHARVVAEATLRVSDGQRVRVIKALDARGCTAVRGSVAKPRLPLAMQMPRTAARYLGWLSGVMKYFEPIKMLRGSFEMRKHAHS